MKRQLTRLTRGNQGRHDHEAAVPAAQTGEAPRAETIDAQFP